MKVEDLMTRDVRTCRPEDDLAIAARIMWDYDCGCVPVIDGNRRVVGMITDRDVCMAAFTRGLPLHSITVAQAMSGIVQVCGPGDAITAAHATLRETQLRRLPVVADDGTIVGILSVTDLARAAARQKATKRGGLKPADIVTTLAGICEPRAAR